MASTTARLRARAAGVGTALGALVGVSLVSVTGLAPAAVADSAQASLTTTPVVRGLNTPVNFDFAGDGRLFVAEKSGLVKTFDGAGDTTATTVIDLRRETYDQHDRGLLGLTLDPQFDTDRPFIYLLMSYDKDPFGTEAMPRWGGANGNDACSSPPGPNTDGCTSSGLIVRYAIRADGTADPDSRRVILDGSEETGGGWCQQFASHSIGEVGFGPDGMLYVSAGDGASFNAVDYGQYGQSTASSPTPKNPCNDRPGGRGTALTAANAEGGALRSQAPRSAPAQGYVSWDGAILRIDPETGAAAPGNPLVNNGIEGDDRIVAYGLRNPFRFSFRPGTSQMWLGDVGWGTYEEINSFDTGTGQTQVPNFGWPCHEGPDRQSGYDNANISMCESLYASPTSSLGGVSSPLKAPSFAWRRTSNSPAAGCGSGGGSATGGVFVENTNWPEDLRGSYLFADYARGCIVALPLTNGQPDPSRATAVVTGEPAVAIKTGPGGDPYYIDIAQGSIQRLRPVNGNQPPRAAFTATPTSGKAPLAVTFDASATTDPDEEPLTLSWDLDGDGDCDDATGVTAARTYTAAGSVTVTLCAVDQLGQRSTESTVINVDNTGPQVTVAASSAGTGWKVGDPLTFTATASDEEDGTLPASAYSWSFQVRHCADTQENGCHSHPTSATTNGSTATLEAPDHEYYAYVRATVTVTDSSGARSSAVVDAHPRTSTIRVSSTPVAVPLTVGPRSGTSPVTGQFLEGGVAQLIAPPSATLDGVEHRFVRWSDGNTDANRELAAPAGETALRAEYEVVVTPVDAAPRIVSATSTPATLTLYWMGGTGSVQVDARATDDRSVASVAGTLTSTSGRAIPVTMSRVSGTAADGAWRGNVRLGYGNVEALRHQVSVRATDSAGQSVRADAGQVRIRRCFLFFCNG